MSEEILAPILTVVILVALVLWVPTLHVCNARCQSILRWRSNRARRDATQKATQIETAQ